MNSTSRPRSVRRFLHGHLLLQTDFVSSRLASSSRRYLFVCALLPPPPNAPRAQFRRQTSRRLSEDVLTSHLIATKKPAFVPQEPIVASMDPI